MFDYMLFGYENVVTLLLGLFGFVIVVWAQSHITSAYQRSKRIKFKRNLSGQEVARKILDENGLSDIYIVEVKGELSDHYDPKRKVIRLSKEVFHGTSIASISVAAHEVGHAIQDQQKYGMMRFRSTLVPFVNFITYIGYFALLISLFGGVTGYIKLSILMILANLIFQLVTLPVEFDASKRAEESLLKLGLIDQNEKESVHQMLKAAAFTYVASFISTILSLLRLMIMLGEDRD